MGRPDKERERGKASRRSARTRACEQKSFNPRRLHSFLQRATTTTDNLHDGILVIEVDREGRGGVGRVVSQLVLSHSSWSRPLSLNIVLPI